MGKKKKVTAFKRSEPSHKDLLAAVEALAKCVKPYVDKGIRVHIESNWGRKPTFTIQASTEERIISDTFEAEASTYSRYPDEDEDEDDAI
jgi:hypothetical protein